jgi:hypothetical protein
VSATVFLILFAVGSAAVAWWCDDRFPGLAPENLRAALIHVGVSVVAAQVLVPIGLQYLLASGSQAVTLVAVFGLALPALTYSFIAAIWVLKLVRGMLGLGH